MDTSTGAFRSLVVPLDLTDVGDRVLPAARLLANAGGLAVHLVTTISPGLDPTSDIVELKRRAAQFGDVVDVHVLPAFESAPAVAEFAHGLPAPLLCMATHARTAIGDFVLGSVSAAIMRAARVPAVVLGPHAASTVSPPERLLVCVDEFAVHQPLLEDAWSWVTTFGGGSEIFEVVDDARMIADRNPARSLVPAADGLGWTEQQMVTSHRPADAIVAEAARRPGTVVAMASHLRRKFERLAFGSTASDVIRHHDGLVLVVPRM